MAWRTRSGSPQRRAAGSSSTSGRGAWWPSVVGSARSRSTSPIASWARMSAGCSGWCSIPTGPRTHGPSCTTATGNGDTVLSEFTGTQDGDAAPVLDPASEHVLLTVDQPFANHNGGQLAFGPDGYLWFGLGDGGSGGRPARQRPESVRAARLDPAPGRLRARRLRRSAGQPVRRRIGRRARGLPLWSPEPMALQLRSRDGPAVDRRRRPDRLRGDRPYRPGGSGRRQSRLEPDGGLTLLRRSGLLARRARHAPRRVRPRPGLLGDRRIRLIAAARSTGCGAGISSATTAAASCSASAPMPRPRPTAARWPRASCSRRGARSAASAPTRTATSTSPTSAVERCCGSWPAADRGRRWPASSSNGRVRSRGDPAARCRAAGPPRPARP